MFFTPYETVQVLTGWMRFCNSKENYLIKMLFAAGKYFYMKYFVETRLTLAYILSVIQIDPMQLVLDLQL